MAGKAEPEVKKEERENGGKKRKEGERKCDCPPAIFVLKVAARACVQCRIYVFGGPRLGTIMGPCLAFVSPGARQK